MIKNDITNKKIKQYQQIDHDEIKKYLPNDQQQIMSSIFRNANRKDMNIEKRTINEHFSNKKSVARRKFLKKCKDDFYVQCWYFVIKKCLTILMLLLFLFFFF